MLKLLLPIVLATVVADATGQCSILATGTPIAPAPIDGWTAPMPLGFTFSLNGVPYTHMSISDHSLVALSNNGVPAAPAGGATVWSPSTSLLDSGVPLIAAYWSDHTVGVNGSIYVDNTSGTYATVTWVNHQTYSQLPPAFTVQMTLFQDGRIGICMNGQVQNQGSSFGVLNAIVGVSEGGGSSALPSSVDLNSGDPNGTVVSNPGHALFQEFTAPGVGMWNPDFDLGNQVMAFSPTANGWQCVTVSLGCAFHTVFGHGCQQLELDSNTPVIGTDWVLTVTGMQTGVALLFFGSQALYPGVSMSTFNINAPGCHNFLGNLLATYTLFGANGTASRIVPIPANPGLKGSWLVAQAVCATPNLATFTTSNGVTGTFGF